MFTPWSRKYSLWAYTTGYNSKPRPLKPTISSRVVLLISFSSSTVQGRVGCEKAEADPSAAVAVCVWITEERYREHIS